MGTHCLIRIKGIDYVQIYKHWDGYPSEMYQKLVEWNADFERNRPGDPNYKFAQLLRASAKLFDDTSPYTGWGVEPLLDETETGLSVDYIYTLTEDGVTYI